MSERCETDKTPQAKANATDKFNSIARHNQRHCLFDNAATTNQAIFSAIFNSLLEDAKLLSEVQRRGLLDHWEMFGLPPDARTWTPEQTNQIYGSLWEVAQWATPTTDSELIAPVFDIPTSVIVLFLVFAIAVLVLEIFRPR